MNMKKILAFLFFVLCTLPWAEAQSSARAQQSPTHAPTFAIQELSDSLFALMQGKSFAKDCTTPRSDLRYLVISHYDEAGKVQRGELVCNKAIAQDLIDIFRELYRQHYVIARMRLIDQYDADDQRSMTDNNTSCFNFRFVSGTKKVSKHGQGMAIDINPLYNPYVRVRGSKTIVEPLAGEPYASGRDTKKKAGRLKGYKQMIDRNDLCYKLFIQHGFRWGGAWRSSKDYQHFEK